MKRIASFTLITAVLTVPLFALVKSASANTTVITNNVTSTSTGGNATSNVNITNSASSSTNNTSVTTQSGRSHVEINGKTYDSDGNLDVEENGSSVHITNGNSAQVKGTTTTNITNDSSESGKEVENEKKETNDVKEKVKEQKKEIKKQIKNKKSSLLDFIKSELEFFRNLATFKFLFGNK